MNKLILLRHGESIWNKENRFTGWTDVPLSEKGRDEARRAGELLRSFSIYPDISFTSLLKRAIVTRFLVMEELDRLWTPAYKDWRLNERHYGALQGLNKLETSEKYGAEQVHIWRRSYDVRPPQVGDEDPRYPAHDAVIRWFKKNCYLMVNRLKILFIECCLVGKSVFCQRLRKAKRYWLQLMEIV